jgi:acyl carrier protein
MSTTENTTLETFQAFLEEHLGYKDDIDKATSLFDINGDGNRWAKALARGFNGLNISHSELSELQTVGNLLNRINETE